MKKLFMIFVAALSAFLCFAESEKLYDENKLVKDTGNKTFTELKAIDVVPMMKNGWNLGNTMDAIGGARGLATETSWGQPKTTKAMIDGLAASGVKTIRIPTSWAKHMDIKTYTVDSLWMNRVKEIVDWAIENDMYVILNSHHDCWSKPAKMPACSGYYPNSTNSEESQRYLYNLWSQIATTFNNGYDEHLIFETMNEPRLCGTNHEWWFDANASECKDAAKTLNLLNQTVVDAVRATGGNNAKRFIMVPGLQASPDSAMANAFVMPTDVEEGRLILSVHAYSPYNFAMGTPGDIKFTAGHKAELKSLFSKLNTKFVKKGIPVIVGEYGATNKDNLEDRVAWFETFLTESKQYGIICCLWDNGSPSPSTKESERYGYYNRRNQTWYFPEIQDKIVEVTNK